MERRRGVGITPEYPVIKEYVTQALIEQRGQPLEPRHTRAVGYIARYIALFTLKPSESRTPIEQLNRVVLKSRQSVPYRDWVWDKAKELLPGWMGARMATQEILDQQAKSIL